MRCFTDTNAQHDPAERELPEEVAGQALPGHLDDMASGVHAALGRLREALEREGMRVSAGAVADLLGGVDAGARAEWLEEYHELLADAHARGEFDE